MKIVAFVPAKSTSERLTHKNQQIIDGDPLYVRKILQLLDCPSITEVYLDSDDPALFQAVDYLPVKFLHRPIHLASNDTDGHELFTWEYSQVPDADVYIQALCTAPFLGTETIEKAIQHFVKGHERSLIAVKQEKLYLCDDEGPIHGQLGSIPNSQFVADIVSESMGLYITNREVPKLQHKRFEVYPILFPITAFEAFDIHTQEDLDLANKIVRGEQAIWWNAIQLKLPYLNSAILSDIAHEVGIKAVLPSDLRGTKKLFGRVRTLQLTDDSTCPSIYTALDSYRYIGQHDIQVVDSGSIGGHYAYFGEINAHLAVKAGAQGVVVNGMTRDKEGVDKLGFPVYTMGYTCQDVKGRAYVKSMNKPLNIGGVTVSPYDVLFADSEGVVVIPRKTWGSVEFSDRIFRSISKEDSIKTDITNEKEISQILTHYGNF